MKKSLKAIVILFILVIIMIVIGFLFKEIVNVIFVTENISTNVEIIDIIDSIHAGDVKEHVGATVVFTFRRLREHDLYKDHYYIYINERRKYNVFLSKNIKIDDDEKQKKVTGIIYKVENSTIFIKPDYIDILNE